VRVAVVARWGGGALLQDLAEGGTPLGEPRAVPDLARAVRDRERVARPRWVWASTGEVYPALLRAGVRVGRCHDLALVEALLLGSDGRWGEPRSVAAAWARLRGEPVPPDPQHGPRDVQPALFEPDRSGLPERDALAAVVAVHADHQRRLSGPRKLLAAAESAGALLAVEMGHDGLPWRADVHHAVLTGLLGPRPDAGVRPARLRELAAEIEEAFGGGRTLNPDAPADLVRAFARVGVQVPSARSSVLRGVEHPAAPLVLAYKELSRLHAAHGWSWLDTWVSGGRFRPEYVPAGVVSGRWATRGGGALQIPRVVRRAVVADPGWALVVADARQLEPRVLAALSGDEPMAAAAARGDLYEALAVEAFDGDRARAKTALLGTIYGQTAGEAAQLLAQLRRRFPVAVRYVEAAARAGEEGRLVRSALGRTCPPPPTNWPRTADDPGEGDEPGRRAARGRFTRNFVVQASAADWALALLAVLRARLAELGEAGGRPALVFFQHDEVIVHTPRLLAADVTEAIGMVFGDTPVRFPMGIATVDCYADAK
jgi:DNA polymerase-1